MINSQQIIVGEISNAKACLIFPFFPFIIVNLLLDDIAQEPNIIAQNPSNTINDAKLSPTTLR
jgi:hypothetical protein